MRISVTKVDTVERHPLKPVPTPLTKIVVEALCGSGETYMAQPRTPLHRHASTLAENVPEKNHLRQRRRIQNRFLSPLKRLSFQRHVAPKGAKKSESQLPRSFVCVALWNAQCPATPESPARA